MSCTTLPTLVTPQELQLLFILTVYSAGFSTLFYQSAILPTLVEKFLIFLINILVCQLFRNL